MKNLLTLILVSLAIVSCGTDEAKFNGEIETYTIPGTCPDMKWVDIDSEEARILMVEQETVVYDANGRPWSYYDHSETFSNGYVAVTSAALDYFSWHVCLPEK